MRMQKSPFIKRLAWALALVVVAIVVALFIIREDDCWPNPEPDPVPVDCKPGQPCPVDADTGGVEVKPIPAVPVDPPTPVGPQETTGGATG